MPDIERGNYCDEFHFREIEVEKPAKTNKKERAATEKRATSAREKFENLFKD